MVSPAQKQMEKITSQMRAGQFAAAAKTATAAAKKFPKEPGFANAAGSAHAQAGNFPLAISFFNKALTLVPGDEGTQDNLLRALIRAGRADKALEQVSKLLARRTNPTALLLLQANAQLALEDYDGVIATTSGLLEQGDNAEALSLRAVAFDRSGQDDEAIADYARAFDLAPQDPTPLVNMAEPLTRRHRTEEALAVLHKALAMRPDDLRARRFLAIQLAQDGQSDEAKAEYHRILEADPLDGTTFRALVSAQTVEENARLKPALDAALKKLSRKDEGHIDLNLALGNLLFQQNDFEAAARALAIGNGLAAKTRPYSSKAAEAEFHALTNHNFADPATITAPDFQPRPIFVIGQPRSGTTLIEMILSAHPDVASCGEMVSANRVLIPAIADGAFSPEALRTAFAAELPEKALGKIAFVDKMPANYRFVGPLLEAFPNARILHITRDPRDVALSMWRNFFPDAWMNFTFDLGAMAHQANLYARYMAHWTALYPSHILTMDYSDVVRDVAGASRSMAAFCGLDWVPEMASPEKNTAMVRTASVTQVRQGVHQKSVGGWRQMEAALKPFNDALDPALWPDLEG